MKAALALLITLASVSPVLGGTDPARDYLSNFSPLSRDKTIQPSDTLLRLEIDLDGDGQYEVLLSMGRDQDAKQNNVWTVYVNTAAGYKRTGTMTFDPRSFYLGPIEDLADYGLVAFIPTGAGEGMLIAYLFDGVGVRDVEIASVTPDSVTVDPESGQPRGQAIVNKYMNQAADAADAVTSTSAAALAKQYGLKVAGDQPTPSVPFSIAAPPFSPISSGPDQSASPRSEAGTSRSYPATFLIVILVLVAIGALAWRKRR